MILALVLASQIAAAPLDAAHGAVLTALRADADAGGCDAAALQTAAASATIRSLGRAGGDAVVLAQVAAPCVCGAQNCPYLALRLTPGKPRVLFENYGITSRTIARGAALPDVVITAHDSAAIVDETTYAFGGGSYAVVKSERVRVEDGARKPNGVPVRFAAGASSAALHGTTSTGWYDAYTFAANQGQRVTVTGVSPANLSLTLFSPADSRVTNLKPGVAFVLPRTQTYWLNVESDTASATPYRLTLAIR